MTKIKTYNTAQSQNAFADAEHLWFWFISSSRIKNGFSRCAADWFRPCELVDVETLVTRLYLAGSLTTDELEVLKKYGEARRAPNQHTYDENKDVILWHSAIKAIGIAARRRGWVE